MAKVVEFVVFIFGIATLFFGILALSLDYWQGRTVTVNDILEWQLKDISNVRQEWEKFKQSYVNNPGRPPLVTKPPDEDRGRQHGLNRLRDMIITEQPGQFNGIGLVLGIKMYMHVGLWHICVKDIHPRFFQTVLAVCVDMNDGIVKSGLVHVPQLMFFLGIFITLASIVLLCIILISTEEKKRLIDITVLLTLCAGIFFIAGFAYFVDNMAISILDYQSAFYFALFSALFSFTMTALLMYLKYCKVTSEFIK